MPTEEGRIQNLTPDERETTITMSDADNTVRIWTAQRRVITALRKKDAATETGHGTHGTSEWASFTIPADRYDPARGIKTTRNLTDEQRRAMGDRLRASRSN